MLRIGSCVDLGHMLFLGNGVELTPPQNTWTESIGVLVPHGKLGCCYQQKENGQVLIRQAKAFIVLQQRTRDIFSEMP